MTSSAPRSAGPATAGEEGERVVVLVARDGEDAAALPREHPADQPFLLADDLAAVRGDGVFDTLMLHRGAVLKPERHLARLQRSAEMLGLTPPDPDRWEAAIELAAQRWQDMHDGDGPDAMLRLVYSRGPEHAAGAGHETGYITVAAAAPGLPQVRRKGIAVQTQARGFSVDLCAAAPWQLLGAKTLSYATNMAALRHAGAAGFDDVLFLSAEGEVLEGPRSTLVLVRDGELLSPPAEIGILAGTTLGALADLAEHKGIPLRREHLLVTDILAADSAWFISSVTLAARIVRLDEHRLDGRAAGMDVGELVAEAVGYQGWPGR